MNVAGFASSALCNAPALSIFHAIQSTYNEIMSIQQNQREFNRLMAIEIEKKTEREKKKEQKQSTTPAFMLRSVCCIESSDSDSE